MNNKEFRELSEEIQKEVCICEDNNCKYYPLKHFEKCPKCKSTAFHLKVIIKEDEKIVEDVKNN